jgi:hypothetical protein
MQKRNHIHRLPSQTELSGKCLAVPNFADPRYRRLYRQPV